MTLQQPPKNTTTATRGLYLVVSQQEEFGATPNYLGRRVVSTEIGDPRMQFVLVHNVAGSPDFYALLHDSVNNTIELQEVTIDQDLQSAAAPSTYITVQEVLGHALAAIVHSTEDLFCIFSEPDVADGLAVHFVTGAGPHVSAGATITGAELGFTDPEDKIFTGFVCRENADGNIVVLCTVVDQAASRTHPGDFEGYSMHTFVIDPTVAAGPAAVVTQQSAVDVDVPFDVHQLAEGMNIPINGTAAGTKIWCAGRSDLECWSPVAEALDEPARGVDEATHVHAGEGVWVCTSEDVESLDAWERVYIAPVGTSHNVRGHTGLAGAVSRPFTMRDLGLAFDQVWQRLTILGIDTDSSQDPVLERQAGAAGSPPAPGSPVH